MSRAVIEACATRGFGRIVNIGSINGQAGQYGQVNYAAAKSGIHGFTKALAQEGAGKGITVNAIAPGYIDTDMVRAVPEDVLEKIVAADPGRPAGQGRGDRPRRRLPGRRRGRLHHRLHPVGQRRPAHGIAAHPGPPPTREPAMDPDALLLSRLQFAFTVSYHIVFPAMTIGLAAFLVVLEAAWLRTGDATYFALYRFWSRLFALAFGIGVVTGLVLSYEFGLNWGRFTAGSGTSSAR